MNKNIYQNNSRVQWGLNKKQIIDMFGISSSTFYRRRTSFSNPELSGYTDNTSDNKLVYNGRICEEVFKLKRTPKNPNKLTKHVKYVTWNYFANITPKDANEATNEHLIQLLFEILKKLDKKIKLYYSIESAFDQRSKIESFHTHFLVQSSLDITKNEIWCQIKENDLLMEFLKPQTKSNTSFWWVRYNYRDFEKLGIQYTQKMGEKFKMLG